jgi:hypothetical protein
VKNNNLLADILGYLHDLFLMLDELDFGIFRESDVLSQGKRCESKIRLRVYLE